MTDKNPFENYFEDDNSSDNDSGVQKNAFSKKDDSGETETTNTNSSAKSTAKELKKSSGNGKKGAVIAGISVLALVGIVGGLGVSGVVDFGSFFGDGKSKKEDQKNKDNAKNESDEEDSVDRSKEYNWAKQNNSIFPDKTEPWENEVTGKNNSPFSSDDSGKKVENRQFQKFNNFDYYAAANELPSEAAGFTSDDSKVLNEDGTLNPFYTYWTKELFIKETNDILSRITNPVYGDWEYYQFSNSLKEESGYRILHQKFADIVPPYVNPETTRQQLPIYADWDKNDYGMGDVLNPLSQGLRWYGNIDSTETTFTYNDEKGQYDVVMNLNVTYSAWSKDKKPLKKQGVISLNLAANTDNGDNIVPSSKKVIIKSGSLSVS